ncbi:MAG: hypothetical protein U0X91_01905 [Spirosomataceae bacterium]
MGLFDFLNQGSKKPAMNIPEILALSEIIHNCSDLRTLTHVFNQKGDYDNPQISYDFGVAFIIKGDKVNAKKALIKGASFGLKYPCSFYDTPFIDAVGQCFMLLLTQYPIYNSEKVISASCLSYIYLSRCIEQSGREAHDSLRSRALLFKDHENPMVWQSIIMDNLGMGVLVEPFIISDFYFASQASGSPHHNALQSARRIHQNLDDITIGGKDADEYSLPEMAEFGEKRHFLLFKKLEEKFKAGRFNLTIEDLKNINR